MLKPFSRIDFIRESNRIEGICREPNVFEIKEYDRFLAQDEISVVELEEFVRIYEPSAKLRQFTGMNVMVGNYLPLGGGVAVRLMLEDICADVNMMVRNIGQKSNDAADCAYKIHKRYELLHPFMDCNGRSGRMLWWWQMEKMGVYCGLGFLHSWYYQSLAEEQR